MILSLILYHNSLAIQILLDPSVLTTFVQIIHIREEKNIPEKVCPEIGCTPGIMLFQTEEYFRCFQKDD